MKPPVAPLNTLVGQNGYLSNYQQEYVTKNDNCFYASSLQQPPQPPPAHFEKHLIYPQIATTTPSTNASYVHAMPVQMPYVYLQAANQDPCFNQFNSYETLNANKLNYNNEKYKNLSTKSYYSNEL